MQRLLAALASAFAIGFGISCAAVAELIPFDPVTMSYPVSLQQAEESARAWAGDSGLAFTMNDVSFSAMDLSEPPLYVLKAADGTQEFQVNCITGEMVLWTHEVGHQAYVDKVPPTYDESNKLSLAALHSCVTQFLAAKYAGFSTMNMQSGNPNESACYYYQTLANGAHYMSSFATCVVDEWSGQIVRYCGEHGPPVTISIAPDVSSAQAEQIAIDYAGLIPLHVDGSLVYPQSAFIMQNHGLFVHTDGVGVQRLYWEMRMVIHHQAGYTAQTYYGEAQNRSAGPTGDVMGILVDAHSGEVFYCDPDGPMGGDARKPDRAVVAKMKSRKPNPARLRPQPSHQKGLIRIDDASCSGLLYPPLQVGSSGYVYVRYLPLLYGGTVTAFSGTIRLRIADRAIVLRPGSSFMDIGGKKIALSHPVLVISKRAYVPCCAIKSICDADASWDMQDKVLTIKSGSIPLDARLGVSVRRGKLGSLGVSRSCSRN